MVKEVKSFYEMRNWPSGWIWGAKPTDAPSEFFQEKLILEIDREGGGLDGWAGEDWRGRGILLRAAC